jgi:hypothetical protein
MALLAGMESKTRVSLLLKLTKLSSEALIDAIYDHLCSGHASSVAAALNNITEGQVARAMVKLNNINDIVVKIEECDFDRFKQNS